MWQLWFYDPIKHGMLMLLSPLIVVLKPFKTHGTGTSLPSLRVLMPLHPPELVPVGPWHCAGRKLQQPQLSRCWVDMTHSGLPIFGGHRCANLWSMWPRSEGVSYGELLVGWLFRLFCFDDPPSQLQRGVSQLWAGRNHDAIFRKTTWHVSKIQVFQSWYAQTGRSGGYPPKRSNLFILRYRFCCRLAQEHVHV